MTETVIIQRVIPDYRVPLFRRLNEMFGWRVACAANYPDGTFLNIATKHDFADYFECHFPDPSNQYRCDFPVAEIVQLSGAKKVIAEFSMQNNLAKVLPQQRSAGTIKRYALWSHGWNMERGFGLPLDWGRQYARLLPMARADLVLTYTDEGRDWVQRWLPWKKVIALGNTLDVDDIRAVAANADSTRYGNPQLLSVGRLTEDKKIAELVCAFVKLKSEFPGAALTIIGDGPQRAAVEREAAKLGDGSVRVLGAIHAESDLAPHFKGADYFVLLGAAGLAINHALAYDLPVICYGRGRNLPRHHPEICNVVDGETGLLVRQPGMDALLDILSAAIRNNRSEGLRPSIHEYVNKHGRLSSMIEQFALADKVF
ncbi:glycosyltransferase family 4 protein [Sphingorhabdus contaminans]|uniref:glycosyltransferase family 4 protein n=1 Tax=Sphingorhabdus contaminans TaxID=1343899 RepID=UPI003D274B90